MGTLFGKPVTPLYLKSYMPILSTGFPLCDQFGWFLLDIGNDFTLKVAKVFDDLLGNLENHQRCWCKNFCCYFLIKVGHFWFQHQVTLGGCFGLEVMGGDSCSKRLLVRIPAPYTGWTYICCKIVMMFVWKDRK